MNTNETAAGKKVSQKQNRAGSTPGMLKKVFSKTRLTLKLYRKRWNRYLLEKGRSEINGRNYTEPPDRYGRRSG